MPPTPAARRPRWPWFAGAAVVVIVTAAVVLPSLLDVERYRGSIEQALREATGWEPQLGEIDFSILGGLVLTVTPVSLEAPGGESSVSIDSLHVSAELSPLLRGELFVRRIELLRPTVELVRPDERTGWVVPGAVSELPSTPAGGEGGEPSAPSNATTPQPAGRDESSAFQVTIEVVEITDGRVRIEDRAKEPAIVLGLEDVDASIRPGRTELELVGQLAGGDGRIRVAGSWTDTLRLDLEEFPTEALQAVLGEELLRSGGTIDGTVEVRWQDRIVGNLTLTRLALLAGEQPLDDAKLAFEVVTEGEGWNLASAEMRAGAVTVQGRGSLTPGLAMTLTIPEAPVEDVLAVTQAIVPLSLAIEPPGTAAAVIELAQPAGGELTVSVRGDLTAAAFQVAEFLPQARQLKTSFELSPAGDLEVRLIDGKVAGGPLRGTVRIDRVQPPGHLTFDGELLEAVLGQLIDGFVPGAGERVLGVTTLDADLRIDLGGDAIDLSSMAGRLSLGSREVRLPGWDLELAIRNELEQELGSIDALVRALGGKNRKEPKRTEPGHERLIDRLVADVSFDRLPWSIQGFELLAGGVAARGSGFIDPLSGEVDFDLQASLDAGKTAELVERYPALKLLVGADRRLTLPLQIDGALIGPEIDVNLDRLARNKLGDQKPEDAIRGLLEGLLGDH